MQWGDRKNTQVPSGRSAWGKAKGKQLGKQQILEAGLAREGLSQDWLARLPGGHLASKRLLCWAARVTGEVNPGASRRACPSALHSLFSGANL